MRLIEILKRWWDETEHLFEGLGQSMCIAHGLHERMVAPGGYAVAKVAREVRGRHGR